MVSPSAKIETSTPSRGGVEHGPEFEGFITSFEHLICAMRRVRSRSSREVTGGELSLPQFQLVGALSRGERSVGYLAEDAGVSTPTVTRMIDGLEGLGIVKRRPSETDRRVVMVGVTESGRRLLERKRSRFERHAELIFNSLSTEERSRIAPLLDRLAEAIEEL